MLQKIFPMLTNIMFENIKHDIKLSSSMSTSIKVLHQQIGGGVYVSTNSADAGGVGIQSYGKHADIILERSLNYLACLHYHYKTLIILFLCTFDAKLSIA